MAGAGADASAHDRHLDVDAGDAALWRRARRGPRDGTISECALLGHFAVAGVLRRASLFAGGEYRETGDLRLELGQHSQPGGELGVDLRALGREGLWRAGLGLVHAHGAPVDGWRASRHAAGGEPRQPLATVERFAAPGRGAHAPADGAWGAGGDADPAGSGRLFGRNGVGRETWADGPGRPPDRVELRLVHLHGTARHQL